MKKIITIIFLFICVNIYSQESVSIDSTDYKTTIARYEKLKKEYYDLKDELLRYEGRLQILELLIREEDLKIQNEILTKGE